VRKHLSLIFIIGTIVVSVGIIGVLSYIEFVQNKKPNTQLEPQVQSLIVESDKKNKEAQDVLSKSTSTTEDQQKAKQLLEESINDAKKATELQPNNPQTWYYLALVYKQLISVNSTAGDLAEEAMKKALKLAPNSPNLYDELATIYILRENYQQAEDILLKAITLDPKGANHYFKLGNVYKTLGQKDKARENYLEAKKLAPPNNATNSAMIDAQLQSLEIIPKH